jgi:hypothetical protein
VGRICDRPGALARDDVLVRLCVRLGISMWMPNGSAHLTHRARVPSLREGR